MQGLIPYTINVRGRLLDLGEPQVMGILNVTPDSFYADSRTQTDESIRERVEQIFDEGASMIDIGAYSSRPGAAEVSPEEEMSRLTRGLEIIRKDHPDAVVSVDTFRAEVAEQCVRDYEADIINDVSGGQLDPKMFDTVARLRVPYVLTHMKGNPQTMQDEPQYDDLMAEILQYFGKRINQLHELGVNDIILDPGFGFGKTMEHNYQLMSRLDDFKVLGLPLLAGVSRKSMIYKLLGTTPQEALNGTSVLNTVALQKGASILRVHDVKACVEVVRIMRELADTKCGA